MSKPKPWETLSSEYVLEDRWIRLRADRCRTVGGHPIEPFYVLEYPDWVNVVALTAAREAVLVRHYRHGRGEILLELPGGAVDPAESPEQAIARELREETGYEAGRLVQTGTLAPNPATHTNAVHCFLALDSRPVATPVPEPGEELETVLLPLGPLVTRARRGDLAQALHVASLFLALGVLETESGLDPT